MTISGTSDRSGSAESGAVDPDPTVPASFYQRAGSDRFTPTIATMSPWSREAQHGGPVTALLATMIEERVGGPDRRLASLAVDFLGPIPRRDVTIAVTVPRPGRRTQLTEAVLSVDDRPTVIARGWHLITETDVVPAAATESLDLESPDTGSSGAESRDAAPALPAAADPTPTVPGLGPWGYAEAIEWRSVSGGFNELGPTAMWARIRRPLLPDQELTGWQRALILADSVNGLSGRMPYRDWLFVPTAITVTLHREPVGEWLHIAAISHLSTDGIGAATGKLYDADGLVGIATQPLHVARR